MLPCCLKAIIGAAFGCLTVNYGHIYIFFVLLIFEDTCGWKSAFLVNKLFIYYSPKSSIYYQFFFYVDHFKLLAVIAGGQSSHHGTSASSQARCPQ